VWSTIPAVARITAWPITRAAFCYLNDPVLAINAFLAQGLTRIAYVDIDAHHCDGVAAAFQAETRVLMISTHEAQRWPFTGPLSDRAGGSAINLPLPRGTNDSGFAMALHEVILPAVQAMRPQAVILQCGADAVTEDPLSRLALSNNVHWQTVAALRALSPRLLVLGGGGYNPWTVGRLWSGVWATLTGYEIPDRLPEPARAVLAALAWTRRPILPPDALIDTLRDTPREGHVPDELRSAIRQLRDRQSAWVLKRKKATLTGRPFIFASNTPGESSGTDDGGQRPRPVLNVPGSGSGTSWSVPIWGC